MFQVSECFEGGIILRFEYGYIYKVGLYSSAGLDPEFGNAILKDFHPNEARWESNGSRKSFVV